MSQRIRLRHRWINENLDHYYLLDWEEGDGLKPIVHSLKGGRLMGAFLWLSLHFPARGQGEGPLFYPTRGKTDHSQVLSEALGDRWSRQSHGIVRENRNKQSLLSRKSRSEVQFKKLKGTPHCVDLIDDIVTTGSTARACYNAMDQSSKMTVWSLFYRKSL